MLKQRNFFDSSRHKEAKGVQHLYSQVGRNGDKIVVDYATGLMWQQSGSPKSMICFDAGKYIQELNRQKFAGYSDWRLPTLEEAMSLMEASKKDGDLYIDPVFDKTQRWIWTADMKSAGVAWVVYFSYGLCRYHHLLYSLDYVRAVR